jgi:glyoxylase-like metal-dependent hydrolase (beta-lactamase superfamily II)
LLSQQLLATILQQQPFKMKMLNKHIGIFTERGGTIAYMLGKNGYVIVDSEFPEQAKHLIEELKKQNDKPFELLINTHHHGDHTAGNIAFKGLVPNVLAHTNSKTNQEKVAKTSKSEDQQLYPNQTYTDTWSQKIDKENISLHYYGAGHTDGDSLVHFQDSNIVHMGDLVFNRRHPFIDRTAGASIHNWIVALDNALKKFNHKTTYIFGHAADGYEVTGTAEDLKAFRNYLEKLLEYVDAQVKAGKSKEEILKSTEIPGASEWKGDGIQRPLTAAYEEITIK